MSDIYVNMNWLVLDGCRYPVSVGEEITIVRQFADQQPSNYIPAPVSTALVYMTCLCVLLFHDHETPFSEKKKWHDGECVKLLRTGSSGNSHKKINCLLNFPLGSR